MTGRVGLVLAAAALAAVAVLALTPTGGAQGQGTVPGAERTLVLYQKAGKASSRFVDAKPFTRFRDDGVPRRVSGGDEVVFRAPRYSDPAGTARIAESVGSCTALNGSARPDTVLFLCHGALTFSDGTVTFEGTSRTAATTTTAAVTGGTGGYEGARGQLVAEDLPGGDAKFTLHLLAAG
jgi:hypothetical protein